MPAAITTQTATVKTIWSPIFRRMLPNLEGKTFTSVIMEFPPSAVLRHTGMARRLFGPMCSPALFASSSMTSQSAPAARASVGSRSRAPTICSRKTTARRKRQSCLPSSSPIREIRSR
jgi:hypothetical protein